ncbi:MAG: 3'-5' exonuclease [Bacteroidales bacterium]|nr:3'-5' exonuclease [Bacteroidales bacterium]
MDIDLSKPIVFFDLETTGIRIGTDRIIEIAMLRVDPNGSKTVKTYLINPEMPIPPAVTKIHGITDDDVKDKPTFKMIGHEIVTFIGHADLAGYNSNKFDIPLLAEEFFRVGIDFDLQNRHFIDVQNIFHQMEQRTLVAAYRFYCNKDLTNAHSAEADTIATYEILKAQLDRYHDTPFTDKEGNTSIPVINNVEKLAKFSTVRNIADLAGHIHFNDEGVEVFAFGKFKGQPVEKVFNEQPAYFDWMMKADFPHSTKKVITAIKLRGFNTK